MGYVMRKIVRERILQRYKGKCARCDSTEKLEIDHIIPLSKGGRHDEDNFQALCKKCNCKKGSKFPWGKLIKIGIHPEYILISREITDCFPELSPKEFTQIIMLKFEENDRIFGVHGESD